MQDKRVIIWQVQGATERDWIEEVFADVIGEHIIDGRHSVVENPCLLVHSSLASRPLDYYARFRGKDAFLLHIGDETYSGGYQAYQHFRGVFRNYWSSWLIPAGVFTLPLGYGNGLRADGCWVPASERLYAWSFLGQLGKTTRPDMAKALAAIRPNLCHATDQHIDSSYPTAQYQQVLRNSAFAPCPMGNVNLDSFRVYEALEAGAIPIVEKRVTLDYFRELLGEHPLPAVRRWGEARRLVEHHLERPSLLDQLQRCCVEWWKTYKAQLHQRIDSFIQSRRSQESGVPETSAWQRLPLWRMVELIRHHSLSAIGRRVSRQASKLVDRRRA